MSTLPLRLAPLWQLAVWAVIFVRSLERLHCSEYLGRYSLLMQHSTVVLAVYDSPQPWRPFCSEQAVSSLVLALTSHFSDTLFWHVQCFIFCVSVITGLALEPFWAIPPQTNNSKGVKPLDSMSAGLVALARAMAPGSGWNKPSIVIRPVLDKGFHSLLSPRVLNLRVSEALQLRQW